MHQALQGFAASIGIGGLYLAVADAMQGDWLTALTQGGSNVLCAFVVLWIFTKYLPQHASDARDREKSLLQDLRAARAANEKLAKDFLEALRKLTKE